jgi:hypothetical protein
VYLCCDVIAPYHSFFIHCAIDAVPQYLVFCYTVNKLWTVDHIECCLFFSENLAVELSRLAIAVSVNLLVVIYHNIMVS